MLNCVELNSDGLNRYQLPLEPVTPSRLHGARSDVSKAVHYETQRVDFGMQPAALSIKCSLGGPVHYLLDDRRLTVEEDRYLIVNHEHAYGSFVEHEQPVKVFSLFFGVPLIQAVCGTLACRHDQLLDEGIQACETPAFFECLMPQNQLLQSRLQAAFEAHQSQAIDSLWMQECFHRILDTMVTANSGLQVKLDSLPAVKKSTRGEVFRRIHRVRDFIFSNYTEALDLETLAGEACMAPHHFLRSYKQVMGSTPHQQLIQLRLGKAHRLLSAGNQTVAEVALMSGFESIEHFSRQFRLHFGVTPGSLRKAPRFTD